MLPYKKVHLGLHSRSVTYMVIKLQSNTRANGSGQSLQGEQMHPSFHGQNTLQINLGRNNFHFLCMEIFTPAQIWSQLMNDSLLMSTPKNIMHGKSN